MKKGIIVFSLIAIFVTTLVAVTPKAAKTTKEVAKTEVKAGGDCAKADAVKPCCGDKKEAGCTAKVEGEKKDCAKKCSEGASAEKKCCKEGTASAEKKSCKDAATTDKKCCKGETVATTK